MRRFQSKPDRSALLILLLFGVFAVSVLGVLLSGAGVYRQLIWRDGHAYERRSAAQYVTMRLRQSEGDVIVAPFGDGQALELWEKIGEEDYVTRVYCSGGHLRELFSRAETEVLPEDGETVLPAEEMAFSLEEELLTVHLTLVGGDGLDVIFALRSGGEGSE